METTFEEKMDFAMKLRKIDPCSGILDFLPSSEDFDANENSAPQPLNNISHLYVLSQAKMFVKASLDKLSENNVLNCAEEFLKTLTFSDNDRMSIEKATVPDRSNLTGNAKQDAFLKRSTWRSIGVPLAFP